VSGSLTGLLIGLVPLGLLVACLLFGRYPGERVIVRARCVIDRMLARPPVAAPPEMLLQALPGAVRGGRLIAVARAGRGPPNAG